MCDEIMTPDNFKQNQYIQKFINDLNKKLKCINLENGNEKQVLLDYRKNLINIPKENYQANAPDDLILAYYNRFTLLAYIHISLHDESIGIEYIKTIHNYQNQGHCKLLLYVLIVLSRLINPKLNMIHLDSINNKLSYLCIFAFDAIPQILYYKNTSLATDISEKDYDKITEFKHEVAEMKNKTKEEKYKYIAKFDELYGNDLFLIIDISDSIVSMIEL